MRRILIGAVLGAVLVSVGGPAAPGAAGFGETGEAVRTAEFGGDPIVVYQGDGLLDDPAVGTGDGLHLVVWDESGSTGGIWGRWLTLDGDPVGSRFRIDRGDALAFLPAVSYDWMNNQFLVVWAEEAGSGSDVERFDVMGRRVSPATRRPRGAEFVIGGGDGRQAWPSVAFGGDRGWLVAWVDGYSGVVSLDARRVRRNGTPAGGVVRIATPDVGGSSPPSVAFNPGKRIFLVVWEDRRDGEEHVYGQRVRANGRPVGGNFGIATSSRNWDPAVAYNGDVDEFYVVFADLLGGDADENWEISGQRVSAAGRLRGPRRQVNWPVPNTAEMSPAVGHSLAHGGYAVVWEAETEVDGSYFLDVYARYVDAMGRPVSETLVVAADPGPQLRPGFSAAFMDEREIVVWADPVTSSIMARVSG